MATPSGVVLTVSPSTRTRPSAGEMSPATARSSVVLPHPEGPTIETISPGLTSTWMSSAALRSPKRMVTPSMSTDALPEAGAAFTVRGGREESLSLSSSDMGHTVA